MACNARARVADERPISANTARLPVARVKSGAFRMRTTPRGCARNATPPRRSEGSEEAVAAIPPRRPPARPCENRDGAPNRPIRPRLRNTSGGKRPTVSAGSGRYRRCSLATCPPSDHGTDSKRRNQRGGARATGCHCFVTQLFSVRQSVVLGRGGSWRESCNTSSLPRWCLNWATAF